MILSSLLGFFAVSFSCSRTEIIKGDWADDVATGLDDFISDKGKNSSSHQGDEYVVFDFDNTTAIFDIEEQLAIYQVEHLAFSFTPDKVQDILSTGIDDINTDLSSHGYLDETYSDWITWIQDSYASLYQDYGPFSSEGIQDESKLSLIHQDDAYKEFSTRMCAMYSLIGDIESTSVSYPWITYWFTGMQEEEIYQLAENSHTYYKDKISEYVTWSTPKRDGEVQVTYSFTNGISVTDDVRNLMKTFKENDIKVWICSASYIDVVRAAVDVFGLHDYVTGVIGLTDKTENEMITNQYDYETGYAYLTEDEGWKKDTLASKAQSHGIGKSIAIENVLVPKYNHGPNAGFMDSTGDYNFCTEFKDLSLVVCFNRANRKITDGGGLIAETAMYQKEHLSYDYQKAKKNNDVYYVLQGRDENGMRSLRNSNKTIRLGQNEEKLFANADNQAMLDYFKANNLTTEEILNQYCLKTESNSFGFTYGFLKEYLGYRKR